MSREEQIQEDVVKRFPFLKDKFKVLRPRRLSAEVAYENFPEVLGYFVEQQKFPILCTITGLDEGDRLGFVYHLAQEGGITLNLKTDVPKSNPVIKTVTGTFPVAEIYEREVVDLFGARVEGLPPGNRYPLTDDWPLDQHPLLKDWKPEEDSGQGGSTHA